MTSFTITSVHCFVDICGHLSNNRWPRSFVMIVYTLPSSSKELISFGIGRRGATWLRYRKASASVLTVLWVTFITRGIPNRNMYVRGSYSSLGSVRSRLKHSPVRRRSRPNFDMIPSFPRAMLRRNIPRSLRCFGEENDVQPFRRCGLQSSATDSHGRPRFLCFFFGVNL